MGVCLPVYGGGCAHFIRDFHLEIIPAAHGIVVVVIKPQVNLTLFCRDKAQFIHLGSIHLLHIVLAVLEQEIPFRLQAVRSKISALPEIRVTGHPLDLRFFFQGGFDDGRGFPGTDDDRVVLLHIL